MKTKNIKKYKYEGFGFPIELRNVTMAQIDGEWHPKIDVRRVANTVIKELPLQKERLTGHQIKFIRAYFEMSLRDFAQEVVNESHTAVAKWEKFGNKPSNMDVNIEMMLRLYIIEKTSVVTKKQQQSFFELYKTLREMELTTEPPSLSVA